MGADGVDGSGYRCNRPTSEAKGHRFIADASVGIAIIGAEDRGGGAGALFLPKEGPSRSVGGVTPIKTEEGAALRACQNDEQG